MAEYELKILNLYPDLLNLCGDMGNALVLKKRCFERGIEVVFKNVYSGDTLDFFDADIVLIGGGGEREQLLALDNLKPYADDLKAFAERDGVILATCSGYELLSNTFETSGKRYDGLKVLDIDIFEGDENHMGDFAIKASLSGKEVVLAGFQNRKNKADTKNLSPLGKVVFGFGDNGEFEGAIYKNVIATYMYGPILPKNPELADFLIKKALENKYENFNGELTELNDSAELLAKQFILDRNHK